MKEIVEKEERVDPVKSSVWFPMVIVLEIIALEIGAYSLSFLDYHERGHVVVETSILCLLGSLVGTLVTWHRAQVVASFSAIALGAIALGIGVYFLTVLHYHERAAVFLGVGALCLLGGIAWRLVARSKTAAFAGMIVLGAVILCIGVYCLTVLGYHGRAYVALGTGMAYLLGGLVAVCLV